MITKPPAAALALALAAVLSPTGGRGLEGRQTYRIGPAAETAFVDFLATDRGGQPVLDLKPGEIVLKIDGRVRPVVSLQRVDFTESSGVSLAASGEALPPPFGSNVPGGGRAVVILIDDDSIRQGRERDTVAAVSELLDKLPPHARVVIATPHGGWKTKLTSDRAEARRVLSEISGRAFASDDVECRTRVTLDAVRTTLEAFGPEAAPTILVVSGGLAGPRQDATSGNSALARATAQIKVRSCDLRLEDFLKIRDAAAATRAYLYVIQPDDVLLSSTMDQLAASPIDLNVGVNNLAAVTGGKLLHLTRSSGNPLIAAERESSVYYLAGFVRTAAEAGSTRRVDVQVTRPRITVVRRPQMRIDDAVTRPAAPGPVTAGTILRDPRLHRDLPLRVAGYPSRHADPAASIRVLVFAEPIGAASSLASAAAGLFDPQGRLISEWTSTAANLGSGPILAALSAPPGNYRLRVAALDSGGRAGAADYFIDATLASAGSLRLSGLMLMTSQNGALRPALEFSSEPAAIASLEVYGEADSKSILAALEVADSLNGPALMTVPVQVGATREPDAFSLTASVPIATLAAGDYVLRATVNVQGRPQGRVVRTLRKR
jgi:hypothetical protein